MPPRPQTLALPPTFQQGTGATRQPWCESQASTVQRSPSSRESKDPAVQTPLWQLSPTMQASSLAQGVPSGWSSPPTHAPPDGSQMLRVRHGTGAAASAGGGPRALAGLAGVALRARILVVARGAVGLPCPR